MRWAVNLYTTEKTKRALPRIKHKLRTRRPQPGIFLITLASNEKNLLDLIQTVFYIQPMLQKMNPDIVGVAENEDAAKEMILKITEDVYKKQGNFDVRTYFEFQE